ncbi:MAG: GAF domain-containing protein [Actinobacteria bacterium]|nr:GAF domain-containing protein [Actinomycetota bacterium]
MTLADNSAVDDVVDGLRRVTDLAVHSLAACDGASVSLVGDDGGLTTAAATGASIEEVRAWQDGLGAGPAAVAVRTGIAQHSDSLAGRDRWAGGLAIPVWVDRVAVAALSLYSRQPGGLDAEYRGRADVFAELASLVIANARLAAVGRRVRDELYAHLADGADVVAQACGVLMARRRLDAAAAGEMLEADARRHGRTAAEEAASVVASVAATAC